MASTTSQIMETYRRRTPRSGELARAARDVMPGGITHDSRRSDPYPLYVDRGQAGRKWDVDGNEYVDYVGGHGALLLGHAHPAVTEAVHAQLDRGTHYGACSELEVEWAGRIQRLVPSAERVRFTNSGTEATLMALRLARAFTGRPKIVRLLTHFHGWHDHVAFGVGSHHDGTPTPGVLAELAEQTLLCPPGDLDAMLTLLADRDDIAAVMIEPTGATWGQVPLRPDYVRGLARLTKARDVLLIMDEVITGFRCGLGGAQAELGVSPDLTTLAKIVAGGLPGGAVTGRADIIDLLDSDACAHAGREKIAHYGTFNGNPVAAAAGIAALTVIEETDACRLAADYAARLRQQLAELFADRGLKWCVYGTYSGFHIYLNPDKSAVTAGDIEEGRVGYEQLAAARRSPLVPKLQMALQCHGVDMFGWPGGVTSAVHTDEDLADTLAAFSAALDALDREGELE